MKDTKITDSILYVGVDDKDLDLFESQYVVPNGVSYNSYVILDEKVTLMDTVDMKGDGFRAFVKPGDRVRAGEELIAFDREKIAGAGHSDMVIMVLTNPGNSGAISWQTGRRVRALADTVARID